ncbi:MAG: fused MFS/spermidine synthase [Phycisphaerae bacterium]|nr:fused MFS/spermidine synthase [Phycisphaerae bacterium]
MSIPVIAIAGGAFLLVSWSSAGRAEVLVETESLYHHIIVESEGSVRHLLFRRRGVDHSESSVDLAAPLKPQMRYTELMFSGLFYCPEPKDVLVIGLGGGMLSRLYSHYLPRANVVTVEIDPKVHELAKEHFGFVEGERNSVVIRDGRVYVKRALRKESPRFDLILLDAYRGGFIPYHLTTKEFLEECKQLLRPGGLVVSNMRTDFETYDYQRRTMDKVFATCRAFRGGGNTVVCAFPVKTMAPVDELQKRARELMKRHRFEFDLVGVANAREEKPDYTVNGEIFTDDYAPANILRRK